MTKAVDLAAASEGVATIAEAYKEPTDKVLDPDSIGESLLERMPAPTGWRILVLPYRGKGKTDGGVYLPNAVVQEQTVSTQVGYVLKVGDLAYKDAEKFPMGPWCEQGDWVMFARYSGSRFKIDGGEVRILNDDEVLAKIKEPEDILHF
jgi:co-chaperonin GroES (HSP10)|tara:strand:+ start:543 stop:989 length:447 start_codon:yes stop_codon:yes gene_type:complete